MRKELGKFKIVTEHPHPLESPDYYQPQGSVEDNSTFTYFIHELDKLFGGFPYNLLDIGCAGGQFVIDVYNKGLPWRAIGVEGGNVHGMTNTFEPTEHETGLLTQARGKENWEQYKDVCLFHADVSKPFQLLNEIGDPMKFNIVTAWEFFEHPLPEEIPHIIQNIKNHMMPGSFLVGTINLSSGLHHRCAKPHEWWDDMFMKHNFEVLQYPFSTSPRTNMEFLHNLYQSKINPQPGQENMRFVDQEVVREEFNYPVCYRLKE